MPTPDNGFDVLLVADDAYRVAMLRREMHRAGLSLTMRRLGKDRDVRGYLERRAAGGSLPQPALVLVDFAVADRRTCDLVRDLAFREPRAATPVVLLTSSASEAVLEAGTLDQGEATMFSPRTLRRFLVKLRTRQRPRTLTAIRTLCRYGPLLVRQPAWFLDCRIEAAQLTA